MEIAKVVLEYLRILLWPAVILGVVILQKKRLALLLDRLTGWDIPGLVRIDLQPPQLPQERKPDPPNAPEPGQLEKLRKQAAVRLGLKLGHRIVVDGDAQIAQLVVLNLHEA